MSHHGLYGGKLRSGDFKVFLLGVNVNVFHRREVFPAAHALEGFVVHACTMGTGCERMPEAMRRFAVDIDGFLYQRSLCICSIGFQVFLFTTFAGGKVHISEAVCCLSGPPSFLFRCIEWNLRKSEKCPVWFGFVDITTLFGQTDRVKRPKNVSLTCRKLFFENVLEVTIFG